MKSGPSAVEVVMVAVPETAGSALYGMLDVLSAAGVIWKNLLRDQSEQRLFDVKILSERKQPFQCVNGIPVSPDYGLLDDPQAQIIVLSELWVGPDASLRGRYPDLVEWICARHAAGANVYAVCSGALLLAETGLLNGKVATSHWGYADAFRRQYPQIKFDPAPNLVYADPGGRVVTAGGTTSWHDMALHIIARHASPGEALRIAKVYLLKFHAEGELPYAALVRPLPHGDSIVSKCEAWMHDHFREIDAVGQVTELAGLPERTFKRRFKAATGHSLIEYLQNLRVEEAKRLLETTGLAVEVIGAETGYADTSFFRRLFKRLTGLTPSAYRRMFQPILAA